MQFLKNYNEIEDVFCKVLTPNDDSGRHGVLIPVFAYRLFPDFNNFDPFSATNYEEDIVTHWEENNGWSVKRSKWKHYHRYPERRMTSLSPELLNNKQPGSLIVVGKYKGAYEYECHVVAPNDPRYTRIGEFFKLSYTDGLLSGSSIVPISYLLGTSQTEEVIDELMEKVQAINKMQYVPTMKSGDTGIGFTFETLLGKEPNSSKEPDYKGIEIKTSRSAQVKAKRKASTGKQTLFALIPSWDIAKDRRGLVEGFGYYDEIRERQALYVSIKVVPNSYQWKLVIDEATSKVLVCQGDLPVVSYSIDDLRSALENKHKESIFVTAHKKVIDGVEHFHYDSVVHCKEVLFTEFLAMISEGLIVLDFAIHSKDGKVRDHGFLWRLENKKYIYRLFKYVQELM